MEQALEGVRVLDLTSGAAGGLCTMHLADFGADVIKVERGTGDILRASAPLHNGFAAYFAGLNRNKRSLWLDYGTPEGRTLLLELAKTCDVVVESMDPGSLDALGLGWEVLHKVNPKLILASVTGYGQTGPLRQTPAHPLTAAARSGLLDRTGPAGTGPMTPGVALGDSWTGVTLLSGISMALFHQLETGEGCQLEVSALDSLFYLLELFVIEYSARGCVTPKNGNQDTEVAPLGTVRTQDGYVALAVSSEGQWAKFCKLLGLEGLIEDPRFAQNEDRLAHLDELLQALEVVTATQEKIALERRLGENKLAAGAVKTVAELLDDPQLRAAEMIVDAEHPVLGQHHMVGSPLKLSNTPAWIDRSPAPLLGQHTQTLMDELGFAQEETERLIQAGILLCPPPVSAAYLCSV